MRRKARRTLDTALRLLDQGRFDDAANRFYYAAFQAGVYGLESMGFVPADLRPGATKWSHRMVLEEVARIRDRQEDRKLLVELKRLRTRADYSERAVLRRHLENLRHDAERFVLEVTR